MRKINGGDKTKDDHSGNAFCEAKTEIIANKLI